VANDSSIKVTKNETTYLLPNNFGAIQTRYLSRGSLIEDVTISVEKNKKDKEKVYINLSILKPVKLLWIFNTRIKERITLDAADSQEVFTTRPWWSIFAKDRSPEESIRNYCEEDTDCQKFENENLCDGTLYCNSQRKSCELNPSTVIDCPVKNSDDGCLTNACNQKTGKCEMVSVQEDMACDDGNSCTQTDSCKSGKCVGSKYTCQCEINADCQKYEDNDLCNGTLYCNAGTKTCDVNPSTLVSCFTGETNGCIENKCNPLSGKCELTAVSAGSVCPSPSKCFDARCSGEGQCLMSWDYTKVLDDGNKCECIQNSDCQNFEDGDLCNGTMYCNKQNGTCELNPATVILCPNVNDSECMKNNCVPETGYCKMEPVNSGLSCTPGHECYDATCSDLGECIQTWNYEKTYGTGKKCECMENSDCGKFEDGDLCNGTLYCDKSDGTCKLSPVTVVTCPSVYDTEKQENKCQPETGECVMTAVM